MFQETFNEKNNLFIACYWVCYVKQASINGGVYAQAFKDIIGKAYVGNKNYINYTYIKIEKAELQLIMIIKAYSE